MRAHVFAVLAWSFTWTGVGSLLIGWVKFFRRGDLFELAMWIMAEVICFFLAGALHFKNKNVGTGAINLALSLVVILSATLIRF